MQQSPLPQSWRELIFLLLGTLILLIPESVRRYRDRKKSHLEDTEAEARVERTHAEVVSLRLRDDLATGEGVGKMLNTLIEAGDQLRDMQRRVIQAEADAQAAQLFVEQINMAAKLTVCEHHPAGIRLADFTPQQLNRLKQT